jgi:AbrB family looped-hinge helix DNA binding protein
VRTKKVHSENGKFVGGGGVGSVGLWQYDILTKCHKIHTILYEQTNQFSGDQAMLVCIDKRGSINLPSALRKDLNLHPGSFLDLTVLDGGNLSLSPVAVYPTVRLSDSGLAKLDEARKSGVDKMPDWLREEMANAATDPV